MVVSFFVVSISVNDVLRTAQLYDWFQKCKNLCAVRSLHSRHIDMHTCMCPYINTQIVKQTYIFTHYIHKYLRALSLSHTLYTQGKFLARSPHQTLRRGHHHRVTLSVHRLLHRRPALQRLRVPGRWPWGKPDPDLHPGQLGRTSVSERDVCAVG